MTVCRMVAHNERADLLRGPFMDTIARMVEGGGVEPPTPTLRT